MTTKTIMLVDDMRTNLELLEDIMTMGNYRVIKATSGAEALALLEDETPDLFALDVMMPEMSGFELCEHIKAKDRFKGTPVMFISAYYDREEKKRAEALGVTEYVAKPYSVTDVLTRVNHLIEQSS